MLKKVSAADLKENMRFSAPVFFDDGVYMFADEGVPLHKREIDALARWDIPYVLTAGEPLKDGEAPSVAKDVEDAVPVDEGDVPSEYPSGNSKRFIWTMDDVSASKPPQHPQENAGNGDGGIRQMTLAEAFPDGKVERIPASMRNTQQYASYKSFVEAMDGLFDSMKKSAAPSCAVENVASDLRLFILESRASAVRCIFGNDIEDREMAKNAVHSAIVSMLVAENLLISDNGIGRLIMGALLHDVGMLRVPDTIIEKEGKLSKEELAVIHYHPIYGYNMIRDDLHYPEEVALAALEHHECWDGSGYPNAIEGEKISIQARIISAADAFIAMVSARAYRAKFSGYEAMKNLVADNARRFDPDIVKAMIQNIGIYPVGSIVLLNNAAIARVIQVFPGSPLRPVVKIIVDEAGQSYPDDESEAVDLRVNKDLFIVRDINPAEI